MTGVKERPSLTEGAILSKMILYVIPIILTGVLQLLYNTADQIVVGQFSGDPNALAAVGSTGTLTALIVNMLFGMSAGTSVIVARCYGSKDKDGLERAVHTSMLFALIGGVVMMTLGLLICRPGLILMETKEDILDSAVLYMSIILCGVPASSVFNFAAAIIRSTGDSQTPFKILATSGLVNILFNLLFVIVFGIGVAGVALATIISQYLSAVWAVLLLLRTKEDFRLSPRKLRLDARMFRQVLLIGIPSGIQSSLFSISNILIQSSINTFTTPEVSGSTISSTLEGYAYMTGNCFYQTTITFVGQNYGAGKYDRVRKTLAFCILQAALAVFLVSGLELLLAHRIVPIFVDMTSAVADQIVEAAIVRMKIVLVLHFLTGPMDVLTGYLRALGMSVLPMVTSFLFACGLRVLWCVLVFPLYATPLSLFIVFPISWFMIVLSNTVFSIFVSKKTLHPKQEALAV